MPGPDIADTEGGDRHVAASKLLRHASSAPGRVLRRQQEDRPFDVVADSILRIRLATHALEQSFLAALFEQITEAIEAVTAEAELLAGAGHVAQAFGKLQKLELVT